MPKAAKRLRLRLHLTNIAGLGAVRLAQSLLPALVRAGAGRIAVMYLPAQGGLAAYHPTDEAIQLQRYCRFLPNALSRFLECTLLARQFDGDEPLLVLGDIPLRCKTRQTVFVQTPMVIEGESAGSLTGAIKYRISRWLFRFNMEYAERFVVQTTSMRAALLRSYPQLAGRLEVVTFPPPDWILDSGLRRKGRSGDTESALRLFYPAATYPHKNHHLLALIKEQPPWPISSLVLTIPAAEHPNPRLDWTQCVGQLTPEGMLEQYRNADGLLFLSLTESLGLPLLEAMWIGLPVICPDLPYAHELCGEQAIYFDPHDADSLRAAVCELQLRLARGWWPDWTKQQAQMPAGWDAVATQMMAITTGETEQKTL